MLVRTNSSALRAGAWDGIVVTVVVLLTSASLRLYAETGAGHISDGGITHE